MRPSRLWVWIVALCAVISLGVLCGCSTGERPPSEPPQPNSQPSSQPGSQPSDHPGMTPPAPPGGPVLVVKIDNSPDARPPVGVGSADAVYVEPVEGGLSRVAAVFSSHEPPVVGPVRSARETDLTLLPQFGRPTLAFSGAAPELLPLIDRAPLHNASADLLAGSYFRDNARKAPHNLFAHTAQLPQGDSWSPQSQLHFGPAPAGGTPSGRQEVRYPQATIGFDWSPEVRQWLVSMDGAPYTASDSGRIGAGTVVLQDVPVRDSVFHDVAGSASPMATTVGSGQAQILRDGNVIPAKWSRPSPDVSTSYTTMTGDPIPFAPGQVWTVLRPSGP